jgi:hypothetical protein
VQLLLDSNSKRPISNSESHRNDDASPSPPMMVKRARPSEEDLVNESQSVPETETHRHLKIIASRTFPIDFIDQKIIFSLKTFALPYFAILPNLKHCMSEARNNSKKIALVKIDTKTFNIGSP